jgi:hypothetical protein
VIEFGEERIGLILEAAEKIPTRLKTEMTDDEPKYTNASLRTKRAIVIQQFGKIHK